MSHIDVTESGMFSSTEYVLLPVVIILCIPVERVIGNITYELTIFWISDTSKHGGR